MKLRSLSKIGVELRMEIDLAVSQQIAALQVQRWELYSKNWTGGIATREPQEMAGEMRDLPRGRAGC